MKLTAYLLLAVLAFAASMALLLPAERLLAWAGRPAGVSAAAVNGSLISGTARQLRWSDRELAELRWRWRPATLLGLELGFELWLSEPQAGTELNALAGTDWGGVTRVERLAGTLTLPRALELVGVPPPPLNGELQLDLSDLRLSGQSVVPQAVAGTVLLNGLHTGFGKTLQLGDLALRLSTRADATIEGQIDDRGGPIAVDGELALRPDGAYRLRATLKPRPGARPELRHLLGLVGPPGKDGSWQLQVNGKLDL